MNEGQECEQVTMINFNQFFRGQGKDMLPSQRKQPKRSKTRPSKLRIQMATRAQTSLSHYRPRYKNCLTDQKAYNGQSLLLYQTNIQEERPYASYREHFKDSDIPQVKQFKVYRARKSQNGNWLQQVSGEEQQGRLAKGLCNTLGIRKKKSLAKVHARTPSQSGQIDFTRKYKQQGLFPARKPSTRGKRAKKPQLQATKQQTRDFLVLNVNKNEGKLKMNVVNNIKHHIFMANQKPHCPSIEHINTKGQNTLNPQIFTRVQTAFVKSRAPVILKIFNNGTRKIQTVRPMIRGLRLLP